MSNVTKKNTINQKTSTAQNLPDVVVGILIGIDDAGVPLVVFPGSQSELGIQARAVVVLSPDEIGQEVALLFEGGDYQRPLIIGRIPKAESVTKKSPVEIQEPSQEEKQAEPLSAEIDGECIYFNAEKEIVLRCGKASITLTKAGKILIRGTYLSSRSAGVNRIKGGSIQLN